MWSRDSLRRARGICLLELEVAERRFRARNRKKQRDTSEKVKVLLGEFESTLRLEHKEGVKDACLRG